MKTIKIFQFLTLTLVLASCNKSDFLDKKPNISITTPSTLKDFQLLLENTNIMGYTSALPQMGSDDYFLSYDDYKITSSTERNSYIWAKGIYNGDEDIQDWNSLYKQILYANTVLDGLEKSNDNATNLGQYLGGWARFYRAYAYYDLARTFCKSYNSASANTDLGVPIKLSGAIDNLEKRATLQKTYDQILSDLALAENVLPNERAALNPNRPSKVSLYAFLARIYLDMGNYPKALENSNKCLSLHNKLINYNTLSTTSRNPFTNTNDEMLFANNTVIAYSYLTGAFQFNSSKIEPTLYNLYSTNDLRRSIYFISYGDGTFNKKRMLATGNYPFTGLSTNEIYLIKAECLARNNSTSEAMDVLNSLLITRFKTAPAYVPLTASSPSEALSTILLERRKELIWRGLRWHDLKRLNRDGANITLTRVLNGITYTLPPNDPRWVYPIPDDEIALSGIQQNER
ncbi:MAG: RagB/SusD family nutrient uptake outer membrane protein [Flavobacteriales bacterium]|nr:MAG: RagB/SusD family nutrient uptake outer membrane protein [Flavobacteriales bacterium]